MMINTETNFIDLIHEIGPQFRKVSKFHDEKRLFVESNYELLKQHQFVSAQIPEELGGGGISHSQMCEVIENIALYDSSTALAFSMHQHLLSAMIWKYLQNGDGQAFLRKVADENLVLISTGARDWLESNGEMKKTTGGYLVNGYKFFASQSAYGDYAITSAQYHEGDGAQVFHFAIPMKAPGVSLLDDWDTLGMRGTGSQTIVFKDVFVPDTAISLQRPLGEFHPFWNVVLGVAMPLIMSAYVGIARRAFTITKDYLQGQKNHKPHVSYQLGELYGTLTKAQVLHQDMVRLANDLELKPVDQLAIDILTRKTLVANACIKALNQSMATMGGKAYYEGSGLEILFRDVQAAQYHPLAEKDQQLFVGNHLIKN